MARPARTYTYDEVAARIEQELGVRPATSTLRAAAPARSRGTNSRVRITAGMPDPVQQSTGGRTVFSATAIDRWLVSHPRRQAREAQKRLAHAPPARRAKAVERARAAGLSWQEIADGIGQAESTTYSRQWAQQRYATTPRNS